MSEAKPDNSVWSVFRNRWVKLILGILCLAAVGWVIYTLQNILVPFGLAMLAAYIFDPVVVYLDRKLRWSRTAIVMAMVAALAVVVLGLLAVGIYYAVVSVDRVVNPATEKVIADSAKPDGLWGRLRAEAEAVPEEVREEFNKFLAGLATMLKERFHDVARSVVTGAGAVFRAVIGFLLRILLHLYPLFASF